MSIVTHSTTSNSLTPATQPITAKGEHTQAPNRASSPPVTGSLTNRGRGAR